MVQYSSLGLRRLFKTGVCSSAIVLGLATPVAVQAQELTTRFDIPAQPLATGLLTLGRQAGLSVLAPQDLVSGKVSHSVRGQMTARQALLQLLAGSSLTYRFVSGNAVRVIPLSVARTGNISGLHLVAQRQERVIASDPTPPTPAEPAADATQNDVVITGTAIKGREKAALPVTVIDEAAMEARNALTPIELLTSLPQVGAVPLNESVSGSLGARGDNSSVNLRGIGSNSTLILLNGRRLAPHPISATENGAPSFSVNINTLPTRGLQRIDVLRDGASSLYGSDAVAGVINFVTTNDFRGTEIRARIGVPEEGGGKSGNLTVTHGGEFAGGRGRYLTTLDAFWRDKIYLYQRDFSKTADHTADAPAPFNIVGSAFDGRAANLFPTFRVGTATASTYFRPLSGPGSTPGFTSVAPTRTANPEAFIDVNQYQEVQPRSGRLNWFSKVEYDISDNVTAFGDLTLYAANSQLIRNPVPYNAPNADLLKVMSADNPYNPYGSHFYSPTGAANADGTPRLVGTPRSVALQSVLLVDGGPDTIDINSRVYRLVGGLRGKFGDTWSWETGALYSWAKSTDESKVGFRESLFGDALARTDATAFNPFGYTFKIVNGAVVADAAYTNPQSVLDTIMQHQKRTGKSSIASVDARTSGELLSLWAGAISLATGGEVRRETFSDKRPAYFGLNPVGSGLDPNGNDFIQASPKPDSSGHRTVASTYAEAVIPLAKPENEIPLMRSFELSGSVRYEHYSDFGSTTNPKFSATWRPFQFLLIRASQNRGFSAPNLPTVYFPDQYTVIPAPGSIDPYRNPVTGEGAYVMRNYTGAAADLKPAKSKGKSAGAVFDVPFDALGHITLSADYWQIAQRDQIGSLSATQILDADAAALRAYTQAQLAAGVPVNQIDLGSGSAAYKGDPNVVRNAVTDADRARFAAYNAAHPNDPQAVAGTILSRRTLYQNLSKGFVSGWDFSLDYALPAMSIGRVRMSVDWTRLNKSYTLLPAASGAEVLQQRLNVDGNTRNRITGTLSWRLNKFSSSLSAYYIGGFTDSGATTTKAIYDSLNQPSYIKPVFDNGALSYRYFVRSTTSYNLNIGYDLDDHTKFRIGVVNLTNKEPPLASTNFGYSASVYSSLAVGRTWTLEISKEF